MCTVPPVQVFFSRDSSYSTAHTGRFYTFGPTKSQKLIEEKSKIPISNSLTMLSFIKDFCSNITCFIFIETQIFQLTKLSRIENVNCELLRDLAKKKTSRNLGKGKCASTWQRKYCTGTSQAGRGPDTTQKEQRSERTLSVVLN